MSMLSSAQVCALTGVTYRQLDYWTRCGLIEPYVQAHGSGTRRRWSHDTLDQVQRLKVASRLASGSLLDALDALDELLAERAAVG